MASISRGAQGLIVASLAGVIAVTAWYGRLAWEDSGSFALALFGVPLLCTACALWAERSMATRWAPAVVAPLGVVSLGWSLLTGLGIGLGFLLPSLLLLVAALVSWADRQGLETSTSLRS